MEQQNNIKQTTEDSVILCSISTEPLYVEIAKKRITTLRSLPLVISVQKNNDTDERYNSPPREKIIKKRTTPPPLPAKRRKIANRYYIMS